MSLSIYFADLAVIVGTLWLWARANAYHRTKQRVSALPILSYAFAPFKFPGMLFPSTDTNPGTLFPWRNRGHLYKKHGAQTLAAVGYVDNHLVILSTSFDVIGQVTAPRSAWDRPKIMGDIQNIPRAASNVATAQVAKYPRHLRIVRPAFNQALYEHVWDESLKSFRRLSAEEGWDTSDEVTLPALPAITAKLTLSIIGKVGFGIGSADSKLRHAFEVTAENSFMRVMLPSWLFNLPIDRLRRIKEANEYVTSTMHKQIAARRAQNAEQLDDVRDIFNYLINANASESSTSALDDEELLSNTFILLFAGHETAAKTLACCLGLLACNPQEQGKLYQYIEEQLPGKRDPVLDDFDALKPVSDCLMETLRLFSVAPLVMREATEDTVLRVPGVTEPVMLPKGTMFIGDIVGINYDDERYPDPFEFRPSRWAGKRDLLAEDYISFGNGVHACLGRKFALYEMVCFLVQFVRTWRVEPVLKENESMRAWRERVLDGGIRMAILMTTGDIPVKLCRRT
ncbi:cytochrome P450 [Calocera cornea HHB12733]|uniref:Cytochrome P450 n=1 Tax=Calocera cornea HHB12733 TaxID=1353952 RepID=A0A165C5K6_9BASI|nr:cytochrome P450 [Calocera cornea HHB12733]